MRIAFKFHYIHDNGLFIRLLNRIQVLSDIPVTLYHGDRYYRVEASGDQGELETLAEQISILVPESLFLDKYTVEAISEEENSQHVPIPLLDVNRSFQVPYCPECMENVVKTFNPFIPCSVCGFSEMSLNMKDLTTFTGLSAPAEEEFFIQLANLLIDNSHLILPTYNGIRHFSLLNSGEKKDEGILVCDPIDISNKFVITQGELEALMMVEKPSVRLKAKLMFRVKNTLKEPFYPVFFPDDTVTLALSVALKSKGIDAVFCDHIPSLRVASALEENIIVSTGRDMLPWKSDFVINTASFCHYAGFAAYGDNEGLYVDTKLDLENKPFIHYVANHETTKRDHVIRFEPAHAAQRSIVLEQKLDDEALCGIYFSREHTSQLFSFSKKIGYTPMVLFNDEKFSQPKDMLEAIAIMDEGGKRLVDNFKTTFPDLYEKIQTVEFKTNTHISDLAKLWSLAAVFIGLYEGDDALISCETLESTAIEFGGKSGPRIDYKVMSTDEGYQLDLRLAIRSAISFKLAGLDDYLLSFGFIDSLADFIAQQAEDADANIGIDGVILAGSLFENRQLLMRAYNGLSVNYPIYRNKRLSIDDANVAIGAITLGSEA